MKKLILFLALLPMMASADDSGTCGDNLTWTYESATNTLTISGTGNMNNYQPFSYASPWDSFRSSIKKVIIENGVTSIGDRAFFKCSGLTSITIPNSVTSIGYTAFSGCSGLTSVTIPNSVTSIAEAAFRSCSGLTSVNIPNSVTSIGDYAFYDCSGLTSVHISDLVAWCNITFAGNPFRDLSSTLHLYLNGTEVKDLVIPNNVTTIGDNAFSGFSGLTTVTIPNSVTSIGYSAFEGCSGLTSVTIPNSVTSIGDYAFEGCSNLTSITIPNSVTSIGDYAFYGCSNLTSITIPNSVTSIGYGAFSYCSGLISVHISDLVAWCNITFAGDPFRDPFSDLSSTLHLYLNGTEVKDLVIPNNVTTIGDNAFYGFSGLTSVTIPNSVTSIGSRAFFNCSGLTSVTIPNSVTSIGDNAFLYCSGLTSVTIPNSVTSIGFGAFSYCSGLTSVTIPNSVTSIGSCAFSYCSGLTSVTVASGNTKYDSRDSCNAIIESSTNTLVHGCKNTTIPNSVTSIGDDAFFGCSNLTSITIPNSVTSIGGCAFWYCTGLTSITIPNSVTVINPSAFRDCSGLTSVTIPNSVTSIGGSAFDGCSSLTQVVSYIKEPSDLQSKVFYEVPSSSILYVPVGCTEKYKSKKGWNDFKSIIEMVLNPVQDEQMSSIGEQITDDTNLNGNVVNGIYYCIDEEGGGYDGNESCIVLSESTDDDTMESLMDEDIFSQEFKEKFTGIVFMVSPGKGTVKIVGETSGDMVMKVKIGHDQPLSIQTDGKHESSFIFDVLENTYIYIYGGMNATNAKGIGKLPGENILKIYSIEINNGATGIDCIEHPQQADVTIYNLGGQRMSKVQPSNVYIIRDQSGKTRKVLVK